MFFFIHNRIGREQTKFLGDKLVFLHKKKIFFQRVQEAITKILTKTES
jgi:hypothetical protein